MKIIKDNSLQETFLVNLLEENNWERILNHVRRKGAKAVVKKSLKRLKRMERDIKFISSTEIEQVKEFIKERKKHLEEKETK